MTEKKEDRAITLPARIGCPRPLIYTPWLLAGLCVLLLGIAGGWWIARPVLRDQVAGASVNLKLDLNHATAADLGVLPGIGPKLAERIIAYRQTHGPFSSVAELQQVPGIGPKILQTIRPYLTCTTPGDTSPHLDEPQP